MSSKHSPEPWKLKSNATIPSEANARVYSADGSIVLYEECNDHELPQIIPNLSRIVACVNACAGIPADELHMIKLWRGSYHKNAYREGE